MKSLRFKLYSTQTFMDAKGPQDDLLSTLNHQVKGNYLGC